MSNKFSLQLDSQNSISFNPKKKRKQKNESPMEEKFYESVRKNSFELNLHITILYGLKNEKDYYELVKYFKNKPEVKFTISEISLFESDNKPYDVLKFTIISPDLVKYNSYVKENFDCNVTFPNYQPHLTIAYVNKGQGKKYLNLDSDLIDEVFRESDLQFSLLDGEKLKIKLGG